MYLPSVVLCCSPLRTTCFPALQPKVMLIAAAHAAGVPVISSMGAGGRMDPSERAGSLHDGWTTQLCPDAAVTSHNTPVSLHDTPCVTCLAYQDKSLSERLSAGHC
jgi:hypothetical protein